MKVLDESIELLNQVELKSPPSELYDKINRRVVNFDRRFIIQLSLFIVLSLIISGVVFSIYNSNSSDQLLEAYFSTDYNLYGYE